jgi:hypothetical protein
MPSIADLFNSRKNELYQNSDITRNAVGNKPKDAGIKKQVKTLSKNEFETYGIIGTALIESRGLLNIPRAAMLVASSPDTIADLIGSGVAGALFNAAADRPTDTIFKGKEWYRKPVSLGKTRAGLKWDSIEPGRNYFRKEAPSPGAAIARALVAAVKDPGGAGVSAAINLVNNYGSKTGIKNLKALFKKKEGVENTYGIKSVNPEYGPRKETPNTYSKFYRDRSGKLVERETRNASTITPTYDTTGDSNLGPKPKKYESEWDRVTDSIIKSLGTDSKGVSKDTLTDDALKILDKDNSMIQTPYVLFKLYGKPDQKDKNIVLPGTISGLSEDFAPEVSSFKYVGSPFNLYRYGGVERNIKFNVKLYYTDWESRVSMKKTLDKLRMLVFPDENISVIKYKDTEYSPILFNPNLVYLTINGLYHNMLGIIDTLSFSVEDNTSWASYYYYNGGENVRPHPSVVNVSLGMKVIEHPAIVDGDGGTKKYAYGESKDETNKYVNYFTGYNAYGKNMDEVQREREDIQNYIKWQLEYDQDQTL